MLDKLKIRDIFGIRPYAKPINKVTTTTMDGAAEFLGRICLPAAEEFGLLLQDRVRGWRQAQMVTILLKAKEQLLNADAPSNVHAHPRLVRGILEEGSWIEDPVVQDMWSGLLSSSCTETGDDDSNLVFVNLLSSLTRLQARLLKYVCENAPKSAAQNGLIQPEQIIVTLDTLMEITGEADIHRLDREMDYLREVGLLQGGFKSYSSSTNALVTPSGIALHMYVRCQGSRTSPTDYFGLETPKP